MACHLVNETFKLASLYENKQEDDSEIRNFSFKIGLFSVKFIYFIQTRTTEKVF